jgi:hypothetical protein
MSRRYEKVCDRRGLFVAVLRHVILGLCAAVAGLLLTRKRRLVSRGECINRGICGGCEVFQECALPPARSARHALSGIHDGER